MLPETGEIPVVVMGMELEPLLRFNLKKLEKDLCSCMLENLSTSCNHNNDVIKYEIKNIIYASSHLGIL